MNVPIIRPILKEDNKQIASLIRNVLLEFGVPKEGTAYADVTLDTMYGAYDNPRAIYFIIEENHKIIGGGGISQLDNYKGNVCELQKMYFLPEARAKGLGKKMLELCLSKAKEFGFKKCYLETMPYMKVAQKLYEKSGFHYIDKSMGNTGHFSCPVHMLIDL